MKIICILALAIGSSACQPRFAPDQSATAALKSAENERARNAAEEDAIQAQRQLNLVKERTQNNSEASAKPKT